MGAIIRHSVRRAGLAVVGLALVITSIASAQLREVREAGTAGFGALVARRGAEYARFADWRWGIAAEATAGLPIGIRVAGSALFWDHSNYRVPLAGTGRRVVANVETNTLIASLGIGPQLTISAGPLKLYGYGTIGGGYITTWSSVGDGGCACGSLVSTTNFDDVTLAREVGGGLQLRVSAAGRTPVYLHFAGRYMDHGVARYLEEDPTVIVDGLPALRVVESPLQVVGFQMGLSFGLR